MKKKAKSKLILLFAGLASALFLGGCAIGESMDEILENRDLTARVTYYSNGGTFEGVPDVKEMYYKTGSLPLNIGSKEVAIMSGNAEVKRNNYDFDGWYYAVDENNDGKPDFEDEENGLYKLGGPVDFTKPLQEGDHFYFIAGWLARVKVNVQLVCDDGVEIPATGTDGSAMGPFKNGDIIEERPYDTGNKVVKELPMFEVTDKSYTFTEYYADEACTQLVSWPIVKEDRQEADVTVYAKYIKGDWTVLREASDVDAMFGNVAAGTHYWLAKDIDMNGVTVAPVTSLAGELQGNGYTISNLKVAQTRLNGWSKTVGLFGSIKSTAIIKDVVFEELNVEYNLSGSIKGIYFAFTELQTGATVKNVTLNGKMKITKSEFDVVQNISNDTDFTKCLYGTPYTTDAEYTVTDGFKVNDGAETSTFVTINNY